ncbi:uncharacterized protein MONOS_6425 [Monocercomonoides exilis]|uniref:uncharacterized protein n=1 Tax=Monocercomonoides exilis TaxID=2049356 RepID=UPI00355A9C72|nr:hypothetical protein MONOS_6425 [Monocercomonoides exilis]|eukprot:MONOS_6425.1-p1 / transcript=MONOS_6425.1 / gene=MONOS_6425 / organism=Monocercomonoides_exilis_PA203 / gene_product=unspecified product / transcript_product=unspecified product / location=Mono_scaffold00202:41082-42200(-) / protein_length=354 / sequence_SO=supercontig / SO=protein_coding / is_pseudo=false
MLKHMGYCNVWKEFWNCCCDSSSLKIIFEKIILEENRKTEGKKEKLQVDLCECHLLLNNDSSSELLSVCVKCLLKAAKQIDQNEETQKEVEMALLTLRRVEMLTREDREPNLNEIKEIIRHHRDHHNLTHLGCLSAWEIVISRFHSEKSIEDVVVNRMHFAEEAAKEVEDLSKCIDWNKKEEKTEKRKKKERKVIMKWIFLTEVFFLSLRLWKEEFVGLIQSLVKMCFETKENERAITEWCISMFHTIGYLESVSVNGFVDGGAVNLMMEGILQPTLNKNIARSCLEFFLELSRRLKEKRDNKEEEDKIMETKKKMIENMEEEGYEDVITSFQKILPTLTPNNVIGLSVCGKT